MKRRIPKFVLAYSAEKRSTDICVRSRSKSHRFLPGDTLMIYRGGTRKEPMRVTNQWDRHEYAGGCSFYLTVVGGLYQYCAKRWPAGTAVSLVGNNYEEGP